MIKQLAHACVTGRVHEDRPILQHRPDRLDLIPRLWRQAIQIRRDTVRREALVVETGPYVFEARQHPGAKHVVVVNGVRITKVPV